MGIDLNKHIWEGWTVADFIDALRMEIWMIMEGRAITKPFKTVSEISAYCISNQPYYKKLIPEVVKYFAEVCNIKK